jgi:hypothetical protein
VVTVEIHAVLALKGRGDPLMKELIHPNLKFFKDKYGGKKVNFVLESVPEKVEFYSKKTWIQYY